MALFLVGITLFCVVHLFPALAPASRGRLAARLGEMPYKGIYSLLVLAGLALIVLGWKTTQPVPVYMPPLAPGAGPALLVFVGLVLFFASQFNGYLKRWLRHPQMLGTVLWATSHLLTNGDTRAIVLFGGLLAWAVLEIVLCNRRDGPRRALPAASARFDLVAVLIGGFAFALIGHFHATLFGVAPL